MRDECEKKKFQKNKKLYVHTIPSGVYGCDSDDNVFLFAIP